MYQKEIKKSNYSNKYNSIETKKIENIKGERKMIETPNYYAVLPSYIRYDNELSSFEKLLYAEISALANKSGICWAENTYFAKLFQKNAVTISRAIKKIERKNYIIVTYQKNGTQVVLRAIQIHVPEMLTVGEDECVENQDETVNENDFTVNVTVNKNANRTVNKNAKENNTRNNKEILNNKLLSTKKKFKKPTLEEIEAYCIERENSIDPERFRDYYERNGWRVGKANQPMQDWKACIRLWESNDKKEKGVKNNYARL